ERAGTDVRCGRGLVEQYRAGGWILVVQGAANCRRTVGGRGGVVARGRRVLAVGVRAAAVGRCTLAVGVGRFARRGGIRAFRIRADVVARIVVVAGGLEVAVAGRGVFQLVQVHRVGALGARRHVGDLAFSACG